MKEEKILCPYCSTPFTKEMIKVYNGTYGCETGCEYYNVDVECEKCGKIVYDKGNFGAFGSLDTDEEIMEVTEEVWQEILGNKSKDVKVVIDSFTSGYSAS